MADGAAHPGSSESVGSTHILQRFHRERHAAYRTIAPAWPAAMVGLLAIVLFSAMDQARDALMFTASGPILSPALSFAIVLGLFTLALMQSALHLMSVKRRNLHAASDTALEAVHPSIGLRIGTAFALGILPALVLILLLLIYLGDPDAGWPIAAVCILSIVGALLMAHWLSPAAQFLFDDKGVQRSFAQLESKHPSGGGGSLRAWLKLRVWINKARWFVKPAPLALLIATGALAGVAMLVLDGDPQIAVLMAIGSVGMCSLVYVRAYDKWMRVVGARDRKQLVVDARMQAMLRGWTAIWIVVCLTAFWAGYFTPVVFNALGPATALLMGLFLVLCMLGWCVRTALTPAERAIDLYKGAWWEEPIVAAGVASWWMQQHLSAHRVFGFGVALLTLDISFSLIEWLWPRQPDGDLSLPDAAIAGAVVLACIVGLVAFGLAGWIGRATAIPRSKFRLRPEAEDVPRIGTLLLLAPFLLATLGEDRRPPYVFLDASETRAPARPELADAAARWLAPRRNQPEITAVIVLAEGGGIRSAVHITQLLSQLDVQSGGKIVDDAYALAGVSGGAVGLSTFLVANAAGADAATRSRQMDGVLGADHMTPLIAGMFGSDLFSMFVPIDLPARVQRMRSPRKYMERAPGALLPGRAEFFESSLGNAWSKASGGSAGSRNLLAEPLSAVVMMARNGGPPPVVMFPTFGVEGGVRGVVSNVVFSNCSEASKGRFVDVMTCLDLRSGGASRSAFLDMPIGAAAHMSARFPGSNPPAVFDVCDNSGGACRLRRMRFVDGGYFDNSGAAAAREAVDALVRAARGNVAMNDPNVLDRLNIVVIHAYFRDHQKDAPAWQPASAFNEVAAPFDGLWSARSGSGQFPIASFCRDLIGVSNANDASNICGMLAANRRWPALKLSDVDACLLPLPASGEATSAARAHVTWVSAPINNQSDVSDPAHFLLGWSLQEKSRASMKALTDKMATRIVNTSRSLDTHCAMRVFEAG